MRVRVSLCVCVCVCARMHVCVCGVVRGGQNKGERRPLKAAAVAALVALRSRGEKVVWCVTACA